jgi:hypothetical protein
MDTAEIVMCEVQSNGGFEVLKLLAVSICQARKTAHLHSHREILPLHKRRADVIGVGASQADLGYNLRDSWWGVPHIGAVVLPKVPEQFDKLRKIDIQPETFLDRLLMTVFRFRPVSRSVLRIEHPSKRH